MNLRNKLQWNLSRNPKFSFMKMSSAKCQMSWAMIFTLKASTIWTPVYILMIYILYNFSYCILRNLALFFRMLSSQSMIKIIKIKTWRNRTWRIARSRARQNSRCWWKQVWHVGCECQVNRLIGNFRRCVTRVATVISTLLVLRLEYAGRTGFIASLQMAWRRKDTGHQRECYEPISMVLTM